MLPECPGAGGSAESHKKKLELIQIPRICHVTVLVYSSFLFFIFQIKCVAGQTALPPT